MNFLQKDKVGDIVSKFPKAADVFHQYNIDYCCGGHRTLTDVSNELKIEVNDVILSLNKHFNQTSTSSTRDWNKAPYAELVNHILQAHHAFLHTNLPIISDLIKTILRVHGSNHPELMKVYQTFQQLKTELDMHLIKEETIQYPAIEAYINSKDENDLNNAISVISDLEEEHEMAGSLLKKLSLLTNHYQIPNDVCETYIKTYELLETLELNTFTHIHLENNILFPRLKAINV